VCSLICSLYSSLCCYICFCRLFLLPGLLSNLAIKETSCCRALRPNRKQCHQVSHVTYFLLACHFMYLSHHNAEVLPPLLRMSSGCRCLIKYRGNFTFTFYSGSSFLEVTSRFIGNFSRLVHPENIRRTFRMIPAT
jgi:hypothetical protein